MLNPNLYKAIAAVFKETPRITNEGERAIIEYPPPLISFDNVETPISTRFIHGGEEYAVNCPFCRTSKDRKHRLYFHYLWDASLTAGLTTYRCSTSLVRCFNEECQQNPTNKAFIINSLRAALKDKNVIDADTITTTECDDNADLLKNQVPLPTNLIGVDRVPDYVLNYWCGVRGYSVDTLKKFNVSFCYLNYPVKAGAPICRQPVTIIPVYQNEDYWFYQIRLIPINGDPAQGYERDLFGEELPKYIIPKGSRKNWALYNIDNACLNRDVFIVEGVTDVWRIGKSAIARFGKTLSRAQLNTMIMKLSGKNLIIVPDMDDPSAMEEATKQLVQLRGLGIFKSVELAKLPAGMDPGDLRGTEEEVCQTIKDSTYSLENLTL